MEKFSSEQVKWLEDNFDKYTYRDLTYKFNEQFKTKRTIPSIKSKCYRIGLFRYKGTARAEFHNYTKEQNEWILSNCCEMTHSQLVSEFNKKFGTEIKNRALLSHRRRKLIKTTAEGRTKQWESIRRKKDGTVMWSKGTAYIKADGKWKRLARHIYEKNNGKLPSYTQVVFLDCDHTNFELSNLKAISKKNMARLNKNRLMFGEPEFVETALMVYEFDDVLKDKSRQKVVDGVFIKDGE